MLKLFNTKYLQKYIFHTHKLPVIDLKRHLLYNGTQVSEVHHTGWHKLHSSSFLQLPSISPHCQGSHQQLPLLIEISDKLSVEEKQLFIIMLNPLKIYVCL